jgi:hypothetical protein
MKILFIIILLFLIGCIPYTIYTPYLEGDCVDRAIIIRQDLRAKGYEADIVLGGVKCGEKIEGHAWIKYKDKKTGEWKIIENY